MTDYSAYLARLHSARVEVWGNAFTDQHYSLPDWDNLGDEVRGPFFTFGFPPGQRHMAEAEMLRAGHEHYRYNGKRLRFATVYELLEYAADNIGRDNSSVLVALGSVHSSYYVARLCMATRFLKIISSDGPFKQDTKVLCVITDE